MEMRKCISIHVGQAGVQIGHSCWQLYCLEHGIKPDGTLPTVITDSNFRTFFGESIEGRVTPCAIMVDLEPNIVDEIRVGEFQSFYKPEWLVTGKEDAANNYARGRYHVGKQVIDRTMEKVRRLAEVSGNIMGFIVFHSLGGGTGSGVTATLMQHLAQSFNKKSRLEVAVFPAPRVSSAIVEPYNAVLNTHASIQNVDCTFLVDNEALQQISTKRLAVEVPQLDNLNQLVSQVVSSITASMRFEGALNVDLGEYQTNLVPFPRIHYPLTSYAPLIPKDDIHIGNNLTVEQLTESCFHPTNRMVVCDPSNGTYMACCMLFRGDVVPKDVNFAIQEMRKKHSLQFVDWCTTGFKMGINCQKPVSLPNGDLGATSKAAALLFNTTAIADAWKRLNYHFALMFKKRAFVHWYTNEGMEECEFKDARDDLLALEMDYKEVAKDTTTMPEPEPVEF